MPSFEHHGARIYYEEYGQGFPILTFAPAGLHSVIKVWSQPSAPINPITEFAGDFRVIAMDQRNAGGRSRAPITAQDSWDSYTPDHIALLDHLRIDRCHLYGQCIGGSFILNLLKQQPERVAAAVLAQPIGRVGPMARRPDRPVQGLGRNAQGPPGGDPAGARRVLQQSLRARVCVLRRPRFRADGRDALPRAGRQRRGAPLGDRRGAVEAAAQQRVHRRVEDRRGARNGARPGQGIPRAAHAAAGLTRRQRTLRCTAAQVGNRICGTSSRRGFGPRRETRPGSQLQRPGI